MLSFTIGNSSIAVFLDGEFNSIDESHMNYEPLLAELKKPAGERDLEAIRSYVTVIKMIEVYATGKVAIFEDQILYDGQAVNNYMTQRMLELIQQGFDIAPWAEFMDNVYLNPAAYAADELYQWMEKANMPITPDGCFLAFKKVRSDYMDCHTGKFDNSPGTTLEMDRSVCDPIRTRHCSTGFHFCSVGYLSSFGGQRVVVVKINPKDVTSIPDDYSYTKGRCCRYEVVAELTKESAAHNACWKKGLVNLEAPNELPADVIKNIKLPSPALNEPVVQADSDPIDAEDAVENACAELEAAQTDTGVPSGSVLKQGNCWVTPEQQEAVAEAKAQQTTTVFPTTEQLAIVSRNNRVDAAVSGDVTFTTSDGREFSAEVIKAALDDASIRGAARNLGIQDSTLRGWKKKLGL